MPYHRARTRDCNLHKQYSLTCEDYEALRERADGCCELCGTSERGLVVDHDHRYGKAAVRGMVCTRCNLYLGAFEKLMTFPAMRWTNPRRWFWRYYERAWFARHLQQNPPPEPLYLNHEALRSEMAFYRRTRAAASFSDADDILMPLGSPTEIAKILRTHMSPQGFAVLVRILVKMRETPKRG